MARHRSHGSHSKERRRPSDYDSYMQQQQQQMRQQGPSYGPEYRSNRNNSTEVYRLRKKKRKSHVGRNIAIVVLAIVVVLAGVGGFTGWTLYNSAKTVRSDASAVMKDLSDLKNQVASSNMPQAQEMVKSISKRAKNMVDETSGWSWDVASHVPVYGSDVDRVRKLSSVLVDLTDNGVEPLVNQLSQVSLSNIFTEGAINVEFAEQLIGALNSAAPVIERSAKAIDELGTAKLEQVNGPLMKAQDALDGLYEAVTFSTSIAPAFEDIMGVNGRRTYLILAQSNAEIRSTGGFPGSIGPLYVDNGHLSLGDFRHVKDIYSEGDESLVPLLTEEELGIFGARTVNYMGDTTFIPDWSRVGQLFSSAWEMKGYDHVNGVIGIDPVMLQDLMALTGASVATSDGTVVNGGNAAAILLHEAYYLPTEQQDPFFEEVAAAAFDAILGNVTNVSLTNLVDVVGEDIKERRFMVWFENDAEEAVMELADCDGKLSHDEKQPTLGFFINDESYSKLGWYLKVETFVGEPEKNADGTLTYPVGITYANMIDPNNVASLSNYMIAHNTHKRSNADMIHAVYLSAPQGGHISDVVVNGHFSPSGIDILDQYGTEDGGTLFQTAYQGLDFWYGASHTLPGEISSIDFKVTTSVRASEPLKIVRTATAQDVVGW